MTKSNKANDMFRFGARAMREHIARELAMEGYGLAAERIRTKWPAGWGKDDGPIKQMPTSVDDAGQLLDG